MKYYSIQYYNRYYCNYQWYEFNITTFLLGLLIFLLVLGLWVAVFRSGCILWNTWSLLFVSSATSVQSCTMMEVLSVRGIFRRNNHMTSWSLLELWKLSKSSDIFFSLAPRPQSYCKWWICGRADVILDGWILSEYSTFSRDVWSLGRDWVLLWACNTSLLFLTVFPRANLWTWTGRHNLS